MKNLILTLAIFWLGLSGPAHAVLLDDENKKTCQEKKPKKTSCTLVRRIGLQDPVTGEISFFYKHWGNAFNSSQLKSQAKAAGLETKGKTFPKRGTYAKYGLQTAKGKTAVKTAFTHLWPISADYSFAKIDQGNFKMIEHKTHKLSKLPIGWKDIFQFRNSDDTLNTWIKTKNTGKGIGTWRRVNPDFSLGLEIENVYIADMGRFRKSIPGFSGMGVKGVAVTKDPQSGEMGSVVFSMTEDKVDDALHGGIFRVVRADHYGKKFTSNVTVAKLDLKLPNKGNAFPRDLYWPVSRSGHPISKPDNILGMTPIISGINEVEKWLITRMSPAGLEYLIGVEKYGNSARPVEILQRIGELEAYNDIYFFGKSHSFAVKIKGADPETPWGFNYQVYSNVRNSRKAQYASGPAAYAGLMEERAAQEKRRDEAFLRAREIHNKTTQEIEKHLGNVQTTANVVDCDMVGFYARKLKTPSQDARSWLHIDSIDSYRACKHIPLSLWHEARAASAYTGPTGPSFSDQMRDIQRAIANAPTVLKCSTNSKGIETCSWTN